MLGIPKFKITTYGIDRLYIELTIIAKHFNTMDLSSGAQPCSTTACKVLNYNRKTFKMLLIESTIIPAATLFHNIKIQTTICIKCH